MSIVDTISTHDHDDGEKEEDDIGDDDDCLHLFVWEVTPRPWINFNGG